MLKRNVTFTSASATKAYDASPLVNPNVTVGGDGFIGIEGAIFDVSGSQTVAGSSKNTFSYTLKAGTLAGDYDITKIEGELVVTKATYPGQEPGGAGIAWSVAPGAATWMYDGRPHGVVLTGVPAGVTARLAGHEATDAGDYVATVVLDYDAANYEPPTAPAPLAWSIARRPLTLMAASREKPYDGFPLAVRPGDITASGSGYADGECLDYFGFASITDVGETAATFSYRDSATAKVANYDVTVAGGQTLKVTVGGDQISVTADSATWAYDGEEHRAATWRVGNGDKLLAGHELRVEIDPASVVRTPADGPDGDGVVSNRFASVRIVEAATGADRTRNYNLVLKVGVLRMTNACICAEQVFGADDIAKVYDGVSTQVVVTAELLQPARVRYFADGAAATSAALPEEVVWSGEPPRFTHATNATVWFTVEADYYNAYTGRVDVAIAKRAVTLTTPTKTKTYDGAPLTFGADEVELVATSATLPGGDGGHGVIALPNGESFVFSNFASITDAGRIAATVDYVAGTGTRLSDYAVIEDWGTLTVLASADEIAVTADSATWAYDGTAHSLPSYTAENADKLRPGDALDVAFAPESVVLTPEDGPDGDGVVSNAIASVRVLRHGTEDVTRNYSLAWYPGVLRVTKARMTFDGEGAVDPSEFSTAATYDGAGHTAAVVPPSLLTAPVTVRYGIAADDIASDVSPVFTNAGVHTVFYALDARHYETYFGTATVTIAPRPVTLVSDGAEKVYDGTPLRCDAVRVKDGSLGFVDSEGFAATCSGALTDVGAMENLFDYALTGGALAGNYTITKEYGWLRVTPATLDPGAVFGGGETDADGGPLCARVYNGAPQPFAPAPDFGEPYRLFYALVPGDESAYSETAPTRTHVAEGDLAVYFKFLSPNYAPYYGKGTLRIVPKALTEDYLWMEVPDGGFVADGIAKEPDIKFGDGDPSILTREDFDVVYECNVDAGTAKAIVTGTNNYTGMVELEFEIRNAAVRVAFDALGGRIGAATVVTQDCTTVYGALPAATRDGYLLTGWFLGVTNGAPQATAGAALLADADHTLFAQWTVDPSVSPVVDADGNSIFKWEATGPSTARIVGFKDPNQRIADVVIPDKIEGRFITAIGDGAFANSASGMAALTLPLFCTEIGFRAFSGISTLARVAFASVRDWANPAALAIGRYAFAATGLTSVRLPAEVASLGDYAFADCRKLAEMTVLGRPAVGTRPFRRAGIGTGAKPTVRLDLSLASDSDYIASLTQDVGDVTVRTDAVVDGLSLGGLEAAPGAVRLSVAVERATAWGAVDASRLRVEYRARLGDAPVVLAPRAVTREADGVLTLEVAAPEGPSGFFRVRLED